MLHGHAAIKMGAMAVTETVSLSGATGAPNVSFDFAISPSNANTGWRFNTDGTVDRKAHGSYVQFGAGTEWDNLTPGVDYWIRFTANAGDAETGGQTHGSWLALVGAGAANREILWDETVNGFALTVGSDKVEISTDSGGSTIVATGYYGGNAQVER